ncbi:GAF domain-containing protein [Rhodococcus qingshengii]|uniref:helix-turn-helix domain-containing protein n=1 Tax=Rhodococcus qingshengii TaxID=334542 RepID=UPI0024B8A589|nr:GAF domain-containing protein [Rhodococcus qingshengii]MDJ0491210.1 GAF domain-containing protein [Rhodococcus qingshengii]
MAKSTMADAYRALASIATRLHGSDGNVDDTFELVVAAAAELVGTEVSWLSLTDDAGTLLRPAVLHSFRDSSFTDFAIPVTEGLGGRALREKRTVVVEDYPSYTDPANPDSVWEALHAEGVISVMCAPMILRDKLVGALYVATRTPATFGSADIALLDALASQATVAIENRRLYRGLETQNALLEQSLTVHRRLTQASADGVGIAGIAAILGDLLGAAISVDSTLPGVEVVSIGVADGVGATSYPIRAGAEVVGSLTVFGVGSLTPSQRQAVEHGVTVLALESVKLRSQWEIEDRMSADLLGDILDHDQLSTPTPTIARRAARFDVDISEDFRVLVIGAREGTDATPLAASVLRTHSLTGLLYTARAGNLVVALPGSRVAAVNRIVTAVREGLRSDGVEAVFGIGSLGSPRDSYVAAIACFRLALAGRYRSQTLGAVAVSYDELGPLRFLLDAADIEQTERMVLVRLSPLIDHDATHSVQLLPTLRAFILSDGHYERTAAALFIGTTTLKYRLGKTLEKFGIDARDPDVRFELRLAFELLSLIETRITPS